MWSETKFISIRLPILKKLLIFHITDCNLVNLPCDLSSKLMSTADQIEIVRNVPYLEAIGSLLYLGQGTKPDISFIVNKLRRFNNIPELQHLLAAKIVLRYIKGTKH